MGIVDRTTSKRKKKSGMVSSKVDGLGFSEFIELLAMVSVEGMAKPAFHVLFTSSFSKVLALLTMWGVGDIKFRRK